MDNVGTEKQNLNEIDFNKELRSFEEIFFDTDIVPSSRYRLVENTQEANPGYCNGILSEYETEVLRKALSPVDSISSCEDLDLAINKEKVYKKDIVSLDLGGVQSNRLIFNIGENSFRCVSGLSVPTEKEIQTLLLTIMGIVERRIRNTTLIEFRII